MPVIKSEKGHFPVAKISNPRFTSDSLQLITVKTKTLKGRGNILVSTPPTTKNQNLRQVYPLG